MFSTAGGVTKDAMLGVGDLVLTPPLLLAWIGEAGFNNVCFQTHRAGRGSRVRTSRPTSYEYGLSPGAQMQGSGPEDCNRASHGSSLGDYIFVPCMAIAPHYFI